jgi:hypothetical protein
MAFVLPPPNDDGTTFPGYQITSPTKEIECPQQKRATYS